MIRQFYYFLFCTFCVCTLASCLSIVANKNKSVTGDNKDANPKASQFNQANIKSMPKVASSIFFLNENEGWALCLESKLCYTDNSGRTWKVIADKNLEFATDIFFVNSQVGWAVISKWVHTSVPDEPAYIIQTQDGGKTWKKLSEIDDASVSSLSFFDEKNGYITYKYFTARTKDSGKTWKEIKPDSDDYEGNEFILLSENLRNVVFINEKIAWGYGGGIWYSNDGGEIWKMTISTYDTESLYPSCFLDENNGWIVGSNEEIWHTKDGKTWKQIKIPESLSRNDKNYPERKCAFGNVNFVSPNEGWITRDDGSLFYTNDEGKTWQIIYQSEKEFPGAIIFLDSQRGFAFSDKSEIIFTNDGGRSWNIQPIS